jgi:hypothetical protein
MNTMNLAAANELRFDIAAWVVMAGMVAGLALRAFG